MISLRLFFFVVACGLRNAPFKTASSFLLHLLSSICTVAGVAMVSLGARLTLNPDASLVVRALSLPESLGEYLNYQNAFVFGLSFILASIITNFLGRQLALKVEVELTAKLNQWLVNASLESLDIFRIFVFNLTIPREKFDRTVTSGTKLVGGVFRLGLYQSSNLFFLLFTSLVLLVYSKTVALSLIAITTLGIAIVYFGGKTAAKISQTNAEARAQISSHKSRLVSMLYPNAENNIALDSDRKEVMGERFKPALSKLSRSIAILDYSRLALGLILNLYFICVIAYIFLSSDNKVDLIVPILFLVLVARQYAVSATSFGTYIVSVARFSDRIFETWEMVGSVEKASQVINSGKCDIPEPYKLNALDNFPRSTGPNVIFCFGPSSGRLFWTLRLSALFNCDSKERVQEIQKSLETKEPQISAQVGTSMHQEIRNCLTRLDWQYPKDFSLDLCIENEQFRPAYIRNQILLMREFLNNRASSGRYLFIESSDFLALREDLRDVLLKSVRDKTVVVYGRWNQRMLREGKFESALFYQKEGLGYVRKSQGELLELGEEGIAEIMRPKKSDQVEIMLDNLEV